VDTSVFIAGETGRPLRTELLPDRLAVSVITIGELWAGVLAARDLDARDRRLATLTRAMAFEPVPIDEGVAAAWARLRAVLADTDVRLGINDSWIAATALTLGVPVVTQDADFDAAPGLQVIHV
jgi:predicted nucleic acid-binding protein